MKKDTRDFIAIIGLIAMMIVGLTIENLFTEKWWFTTFFLVIGLVSIVINIIVELKN